VVASRGLDCTKIAVPKSETKAAGASFALRTNTTGDFDLVWCIGHSCPSPCAQVQVCSIDDPAIPAQTEAALSVGDTARPEKPRANESHEALPDCPHV
jgi:hypothetical protein